MKTTTDQPLVSILIPCYNAERWIEAAVESALAQDWPNIEVIVVDDGSRDNSVEKLKSFGDRIRWETGPNRGGNPTRNRLLELSSGTWLQYLDADDCLEPDKVSGQMKVLAATPEVDVVYGPSIWEWHEPDGRVWRETKAIPEPHDPWILLARWFLPQTGSPLWRRSVVEQVGGWKQDQPCCQEHELYSRLLMNGCRFEYSDASGSVYRQWSEDTVCKKDVSLVHRKRMEITDRVADFLHKSDQLSSQRLEAINLGRFETARKVWQYDPDAARTIIRKIHADQPDFVPSGRAAPKAYALVYRLFGFTFAEKFAATRRRLFHG